MGTRGLTKPSRRKRILLLALLGLAMAGLLANRGIAAENIVLKPEPILDDNGNVTGIRISGSVADPELRAREIWASVSFNDYVGDNGASPVLGGDYARIANDGTFKVEITFPGKIVNNGYWSAAAYVKSGDERLLASGEIKQFLVGTETVRDEQEAAALAWLRAWAEIYKSIHEKANLHHDRLKNAGLINEKFADLRTEEADRAQMERAGNNKAEIDALVAQRPELALPVTEFLRFAFSAEGNKALLAAGATLNLQSLDFVGVAQKDAFRVLGMTLEAAGDPPTFPPFAKSIDPKGAVKVATLDSMKTLMDEMNKNFKAVYPASSLDVKIADPKNIVLALQDPKTDLLIINRPLFPSEIAAIADKRGLEPSAIRLASLGSLAIIVNKKNPLKGLSLEEIDAIFSAARNAGHPEDITTWGQLRINAPDFKDKPIKIIALAPEKPEMALFADFVTFGGDLKPGVTRLPDAAKLIDAVSEDPNAIGVCRVEDVKPDAVRAVPVSAKQWGKPVAPDAASIAQGVYPLTCNIFAYLIYDTGWTPWAAALIGDASARIYNIKREFPQMVADTNHEAKQYLDEMNLWVQEEVKQLRFDLMGINRDTELWIAAEVEKVMAKNPGMTRRAARLKVLKDNGGLNAMRAIVAIEQPKLLAKARQDYTEATNKALVSIGVMRNVTVADLYKDLTAMYEYYWGLCDQYEPGLKQPFAADKVQGWAAGVLDQAVILKRRAAMYVPAEDTARNIGREHPDIQKEMTAFADELERLRWAFLKDLCKKNGLPAPQGVPREVTTSTDHARSLKNHYDALAQVVQAEKQKYLAPLMDSLMTVEGKFQAINDYMTPLMPGVAGRVPPSEADVKKWLDTVWSPDILKEEQLAAARIADRNFTDVFAQALIKFHYVLVPNLRNLGEYYYKAVTLGDDQREERDSAVASVGNLKKLTAAFLEQTRAMIEGRFNIEEKQIYTPGSADYDKRYAPPPAP